MLAALYRMLSSSPPALDSSYQLLSCELPDEHACADTRFALYHKIPLSYVVIFSDSTVGLECMIGESRWYLLAEYPVPMPLHKVGNLDYRFDNGWNKI